MRRLWQTVTGWSSLRDLKPLELLFFFHPSDHQGPPPAVFWICSLRMRMLCRCSGGSMAICSGVSCSTCMIRAAFSWSCVETWLCPGLKPPPDGGTPEIPGPGLAGGGALGPILCGTGPGIPVAMGTLWPVTGPRASIALGSRPLVSIGGPRGSIIGGPLGSPIMFRGSPMGGPLISIGGPLMSGGGPLPIWVMCTGGAWCGGGAPM